MKKMDGPKKKIDYHEHDTPSKEYPNISGVASASECTGLMHRAPANGAEWESYQELSSMEIPKGEEEQAYSPKHMKK